MVREYDWLRRLYTRYGIEGHPAPTVPPSLSTQLIPTTDADALLRTLRLERTSTAIAGTGDHTVFTVPDGQRRRIKGLGFIVSTGTWTINAFGVGSALNGLAGYLGFITAGTEGGLPAIDWQLTQNDYLILRVNDFTGAGNVFTYILSEGDDIDL